MGAIPASGWTMSFIATEAQSASCWPTASFFYELASIPSNAQPPVDQARRADRGRVGLDEIDLVEEVLNTEERLEIAANRARHGEIHERIARQAGRERPLIA